MKMRVVCRMGWIWMVRQDRRLLGWVLWSSHWCRCQSWKGQNDFHVNDNQTNLGSCVMASPPCVLLICSRTNASPNNACVSLPH
jgi:hypothetical protein